MVLEEHQAALCIYHLRGRLSPKDVTSDFVYIHLHGPDGAYQGKYTNSELAGWAGAISSWIRQGKEIYCCFDNDVEGFAPQNAASQKEMVEDV